MVSEGQWIMKMVRHTFMSHGDIGAFMTAASLSSETHLHISNKLILSNINAAKLSLFNLTYKKKLTGQDGAGR